MSVAGGLFSGVGRGLMALAALRQAQDEENRRETLQNIGLAQQGVLPTTDYQAQYGKGTATPGQPVAAQPTEAQLPNVQPSVVGTSLGETPSQSYGSTQDSRALKALRSAVLKRAPGMETQQVGGYTIDPMIPAQRAYAAREMQQAPIRAAAQQYVQTGDPSGIIANADDPGAIAYHYAEKPDTPHNEIRTFTDDQGHVTGASFDPHTGRATPLGVIPGVQGPTHREPRDPNALPRPTQQQITTAALGTSALSAWSSVEQLRRQYPHVETEVGQVMSLPKFVKAAPFLHSAGEAASAAAAAGASPEAQTYIRRKWSFMDDILRTRGSTSRMSAQLFLQYQNEFMPGLDPGGNQGIRDNEVQALIAAQDMSGYSENPDIWNKTAKRHGVDTIDLQDIRQGGTGDTRISNINSRYPPPGGHQ